MKTSREDVETRLMLHRRIRNAHASFCMYPQIFKQFLSADLDFDTSILFLDILVLCACTIITILFLKRG